MGYLVGHNIGFGFHYCLEIKCCCRSNFLFPDMFYFKNKIISAREWPAFLKAFPSPLLPKDAPQEVEKNLQETRCIPSSLELPSPTKSRYRGLFLDLQRKLFLRTQTVFSFKIGAREAQIEGPFTRAINKRCKSEAQHSCPVTMSRGPGQSTGRWVIPGIGTSACLSCSYCHLVQMVTQEGGPWDGMKNIIVNPTPNPHPLSLQLIYLTYNLHSLSLCISFSCPAWWLDNHFTVYPPTRYFQHPPGTTLSYRNIAD